MGKAKANAGLLARRPDNSAFKHQRLPLWSPMLTAHTVLPSFYCMATIRRCVLLLWADQLPPEHTWTPGMIDRWSGENKNLKVATVSVYFYLCLSASIQLYAGSF
uniref:Uncharacterized protein n=1 Tax=Oncorhynchus tshawytscha TaxID=74940 RepID=A0A8C8LKS6_ONCTS